MNVFVSGSSDSNINRYYLRENKKILDFIFNKNDLVFGISNSGIMGLAYNSAVEHGKQITGVCLDVDKDKFNSIKCNKQVIATSVFEKTKKLIEECNLLLFLPGGTGTYFELFNALDSKKCNEFDKPIIIFNLNGFFDNIKEIIEQNYKEEFASSNSSYGCIVVNSVQDVIVNCIKCEIAQGISDYKVLYKYGLFLLKDSLNEFNSSPYRRILPYFTYPLSIIETNVKNAINTKMDTNEFYKERCDELYELYQKFLTTILVCQNEVGNRRERKRARRVLGFIANNQH